MRIDYSEPKKGYVSPQNTPRQRKEPTGILLTAVIIAAGIAFVIGFGTGWFFSQRAAKKSFQAATEQQSLESTPNSKAQEPVTKQEPQPSLPPAVPLQPAPAPVMPPQTSDKPDTGQQKTPPLSFYKALPSGQKDAPLGSGINTSEAPQKQPLQAAIPQNIQKQAASAQPTKPVATSTSTPAPPAKEAAPATSPTSRYTVQVASYSLRSEADLLKTKLAAKGYAVYISPTTIEDKGTWYRVRVGKKLDQDAAKDLASKLGKGAIPVPDQP